MFKFLLLLCFFIGCNQIQFRKSNQETPNISDFEIVEIEEIPEFSKTLLILHNKEREYKGRSKFEIDSRLCEYAQKHSDWMAKKNRLVHSNVSVLLSNYFFVGENIAWNQKTEKEVVEAWMKSKDHRENIMNRNFVKIGFGVSYDKNKNPYWCTCFGG